MLKAIVPEQETTAQLTAIVVHDLRCGRSSPNIKIGDFVLTESGLHVVRGGDGRKPMRLHKAGAA